jgi:phage portal protein BeeE
MIGVGTMPAYNNIEALNQQYYSQCLQVIMECIEALLDEGLGLVNVVGHTYGTEFDLSDLLKMDTPSKVKSWGDLVGAAIASPNEARAVFNLMPVKGGESPMIQQQNYSLAAVAKRDAQDDPFGTAKPAPAPANENEPPPEDDQAEDDTEMTDDNVAQFIFEVRSGLYSTGSSP